MKKLPNNYRFSKSHKIRSYKGSKGIYLGRYTVGLRLRSAHYFSFSQLETARRAIARLVKPKDRTNRKNQKTQHRKKSPIRARRRRKATKRFLIIRSTIVSPLTKKPLQVRMGKGKGATEQWVYPAAKSRILLECSTKHFTLRRIYFLFKKASKKLPPGVSLTYKRFRRETL